MRRVDFDTWEEILLTITRNKTRSVLTAFGILLGNIHAGCPHGRSSGYAGHAFTPVSGIRHQFRLYGDKQDLESLQGFSAGKVVEHGKSGCGTHTQLCARHRCGDCHHRTMGSKYRTRGIHAVGNPERTLSGIRQDRRTDYPYGTFAERNRYTRPPEGVRHREAYLRNALSQERQSVRTIH